MLNEDGVVEEVPVLVVVVVPGVVGFVDAPVGALGLLNKLNNPIYV